MRSHSACTDACTFSVPLLWEVQSLPPVLQATLGCLRCTLLVGLTDTCFMIAHTSMPKQHCYALTAGQLVLERTSVLLAPDGRLEARFTVGLPARGRSIMGEWAAQILTDHLPR
jgi:hypothetical protein